MKRERRKYVADRESDTAVPLELRRDPDIRVFKKIRF